MTTTTFIICPIPLLVALIFVMYWLVSAMIEEYLEGHRSVTVIMIVLVLTIVAAALPWCWL